MFFLTKMEHKLLRPPHKLSIPLEEAIKSELDQIFLDKVIAKYGLCLSIYDIEPIKGGIILPTEGSPTYTVVFRMIVFRPYVGEVISAKLKESNLDGIRLSMGFFEDIYIPSGLLPCGTENNKDPTEDKAVWCYDDKLKKWAMPWNDSLFDVEFDEEIMFRVIKVDYPPIPQEEVQKPFALCLLLEPSTCIVWATLLGGRMRR
ncbi:DNA-directed RNA polymerase III subunit rpc8-like protein [Drosera capensis]